MSYDIEKKDDILRFYDKDGNEIKLTEIPYVRDGKIYDIKGNEIALKHEVIKGTLEVEDDDNKGEYSANQIKLVASDYYIIMDMDDDNALMSYTLYDSDDNELNNFKITDEDFSTPTMIVSKGEDNHTIITDNQIKLVNGDNNYTHINQIDDQKRTYLALKDKDDNVLSSVTLEDGKITLDKATKFKESAEFNAGNDVHSTISKNSVDLHCKNYYATLNKYDGDDDKRFEITIRDSDDNVLNKIVTDDVSTIFDKNIISKGDISTDGSGVYVKKDDDNQIDIQVNEIKLWAKRSDDDKKTYMYLNQTDDSSGSDICFRDKDDNNLALIRLADNLITMANHTNIKSDLTIQEGNDNSMILHDNEIKLKAKKYYFYVNKDDGDNANCRLEVRDNDDNVKSSIVMGTGSTDISNAVKIMDNKLTINSGSDYYTEINTNDITFGAGDDGGKAVFTKTNTSTDCRLENMDKDGNVLSKIKFQGNYVEVGNSGNNLHLSTTSYRFDKLHGSDTKIKADSDLDKGWYSIATFSKNKGRGMARFMILDAKSSHHQVIDFGVTHMYGADGSNNISVFQQAYYDKQVVNKIRIKEAGTYDGAVVQILISDDADGENDLSVFYLGHNPYEDGWKLKNFIPDDTDPGDVDNYDDMTEKVRVNMTNQKSGSFYGRDIFFRDGKGVAFMNDTDGGVNVAIHTEGEHLYIREPEDSNKEWMRIEDDKDMWVFGKKIFRDIAHDFSDNGYQKLGGSGLIIQWGTYKSTDDGDQDFDLPITFPNKCISLVLTGTETDGDSSVAIPFAVKAKYTDKFTIDRDDDIDNDVHFNMIAIGY